MADMTSMNVSLPQSMKSWVEERVQSGAYANASDYLRDLIRHDQQAERDRLDSETLSAIREGLEDYRTGRSRPAEEVFRRLEGKLGAG